MISRERIFQTERRSGQRPEGRSMFDVLKEELGKQCDWSEWCEGENGHEYSR